MKFCHDHTQRLTAALVARDLLRVCESDFDVFARKVHALEHAIATGTGVPACDFEPFAYCQLELARHAFIRLGAIRCAPSPDGTDQCPICLLNLTHLEVCDDPSCTVDYEAFIPSAVDHAATAWAHVQQVN